jgi:hypothetical protein
MGVLAFIGIFPPGKRQFPIYFIAVPATPVRATVNREAVATAGAVPTAASARKISGGTTSNWQTSLPRQERLVTCGCTLSVRTANLGTAACNTARAGS